MASKTNTISHMMYATEWDHVNVSYMKQAEVDGEKFSGAADMELRDEAVLVAARALEAAVVTALGAASGGAVVRTKRQERDAKREKMMKAGVDEAEASALAGMPDSSSAVDDAIARAGRIADDKRKQAENEKANEKARADRPTP